MGHPFFPDRPVDEARSLWQIQQGGVPLRAQRRIHELVSSPRPIFTSTLTTSETVVARATGVEPISQVMGSSVYHVGFRGFTSWTGGELTTLTAAYDRARSLALSRMQQEAQQLGAHMVIDVRFLGRGYEWAEDLIEFTAVGTAVRVTGVPAPERPVLTLLTADDLFKLHRAGYWPVALALGNCFYYARHADCASEGTWWSSELPVHTEASQVARDLAVERFRAFAAHFNADGVVGVRVQRRARDHEWESNERTHTSFHVDMLVMGTAVVRRGDAKDPPRPGLVVDLRDIKTRYGTHG
jgi:uncharacterized protein YbjQ (UPF0145 family)